MTVYQQKWGIIVANSLNRNLKIGDKLVVGRTVVEVAGQSFGAFAFTAGQKPSVRIPGETETVMVSGYDIDPEATNQRFSKENGWDEPDDAQKKLDAMGAGM